MYKGDLDLISCSPCAIRNPLYTESIDFLSERFSQDFKPKSKIFRSISYSHCALRYTQYAPYIQSIVFLSKRFSQLKKFKRVQL